MISIPLLTPQQAAICEILWGCDHMDQVNAFINGLQIEVRPIAHALVQIFQIEAMDELVVNAADCTDALDYLNKFTKGK